MSDTVMGRSATRRRRGYWAIGTLSISALGAAGILVIGTTGGAVADSSSSSTQGSSYAQSLQITPHEGSLAVGAVLGEALAGHTATFSRAQSLGWDWGAVGESLKGYNCGSAPSAQQTALVPDPLIAESGNPGAAQGETVSPSQSDYFANEYAQAVDTPYSEADTTYGGPIVAPSNAFIVSGMASKSWSGLVNGVIQAGATSDISSLNIGNGAVVLDGLDWSTTYPLSGGTPTGTFSIGQVLVNGIALPNVANLQAVQSAVNTALSTVGIQLQIPQATMAQGVESVPPLEIDVVPNSTRDAAIDAAVTALQPDYYAIANGLESGFATDPAPWNGLGSAEASGPGAQLAQALCQSDTPITVLDITLAAFDGGGYFSASLGGVNASVSQLATNAFSLGALGFGNLNIAGSSQFIPGTGNLGTGLSLPSSSSLTPAQSATAPTQKNSLPARVRLPAKLAAGSLLAAGLGGLALLALLVEGDRRMMRRAQQAALSQK